MSPENIVAIATGTTGLTAFLIYAVRLLWVSHERQDADVRAQRDIALKGWQDQTAVTDRATDATEKLIGVIERQARANTLSKAGRPNVLKDQQ